MDGGRIPSGRDVTMPCKGCTVRRIGCHATCERGKAQETDNAAKREYLKQHTNSALDEYIIVNTLKRRKRR